ncbi:MAG: GNAT family N-acetyltransferase [Planctomycetota bacterium]
MPVEVLTTSEQLTGIAEAWDRLAAGHPMRGHAWAESWWRHYGGGQLFVVTVTEAERIVGLAPWRIEASARHGRAIRWLGDGEVCSDHLTLLAAEGQQQHAVDAIADFLSEDFNAWDLLRLDDTDTDDAGLDLLCRAFADRGARYQTRGAGACWRIALPGDWDAYLASQSKSHRKQLRRTERGVMQSGACRLHAVTSHDDWRRAWPLFVDLHQRRRQSLGEPGCFASPRFAAFHAEVSQRLLELGQLRLSWLELDGRPAAAEYQFAGAGCVFAYQGGLEPELLDQQPGRISSIFAIRAAMDAGAKAYDLLRGDEPYKAHWRAEPRQTCHRQLVPPRPAARVRAGADRLVAALKSGVKSLGGAPGLRGGPAR